MKTNSTQRTIDAIAPTLWQVEECTRWLDEIYAKITWEADAEWFEITTEQSERHPVTQLIDAVYQDLTAAGYWTALEWGEIQRKPSAEERASASEGADAK